MAPLGGDAQRHLVRRRHVMLLPRLSLHVASQDHPRLHWLQDLVDLSYRKKMGAKTPPDRSRMPLCPRVLLGDAVVMHYKNPISRLVYLSAKARGRWYVDLRPWLSPSLGLGLSTAEDG